MNTKTEILRHLRQQALPAADLPGVTGNWMTFPDPKKQFCEVLEAVGGRAIPVAGMDGAAAGLDPLETFQQARHVWSCVPEIASRGADWDQVSDPHDLESLDFCVVPGAFGVAENGAVWLSDEVIPHRAALFIAQHLVLVVPADKIVQNMHEAYEIVSFDEARFGIFISGPSKTADIEQSLVIGAHGARSLTVLLAGAG